MVSGNDDDGEEKIPVPVKTVDKQTTGTVKRTVEPQAPVRGSGGNRRGGPGGSEGGTWQLHGGPSWGTTYSQGALSLTCGLQLSVIVPLVATVTMDDLLRSQALVLLVAVLALVLEAVSTHSSRCSDAAVCGIRGRQLSANKEPC